MFWLNQSLGTGAAPTMILPVVPLTIPEAALSTTVSGVLSVTVTTAVPSLNAGSPRYEPSERHCWSRSRYRHSRSRYYRTVPCRDDDAKASPNSRHGGSADNKCRKCRRGVDEIGARTLDRS